MAGGGRRRALDDPLAVLKDESTERMLLGHLLLRPEAWSAYDAAGLSADSWACERHEQIWAAMTAVAEDGKPLDYQQIRNRLRDTGQLEAVGESYLVQLIDGVPRLPAENVQAHADRLRALAQGRTLWYLLDRARAALVTNPGAMDDALEGLVAQLAALQNGHRPRHAIVVNMADVAPEAIAWLWPGRLAAGKLTLFAGDPGLGKSTVALDLCARISSGRAWPDGSIGRPPADVVILSAEDGLGDTVRPRLDALEADVRRVHVLQAIAEGGGVRGFSLARDLGALERVIVDTGAALVVIDPVSAYFGDDTDSHKDAEIRAVLAPLAALVERTSVALILIAHLNKDPARRAIYRVGGSIGLVAAVRLAYVVAEDPENEARRLVVPIKTNICAKPAPLAFGFGDGRLAWERDPVEPVDVNRVLRDDGSDGGELRDADAFLRDVLADGELEVKDVVRAATGVGLSRATVYRAADRLRIVRRTIGQVPHHRALWRLPSSHVPQTETLETKEKVQGFPSSHCVSQEEGETEQLPYGVADQDDVEGF